MQLRILKEESEDQKSVLNPFESHRVEVGESITNLTNRDNNNIF